MILSLQPPITPRNTHICNSVCNHTGQRLLSSLSNPCGAEVFNAELVAGRRVSWEPSLTRNTSVLRSMTTDLAEKTLSSSGLVRLSRHARSVFCLESVVIKALYFYNSLGRRSVCVGER